MKSEDLKERIFEALDVESKWQQHLEENEMGFPEKWQYSWNSAKEMYQKGWVPFTLFVLITIALHILMEVATSLPLPNFIFQPILFMYILYAFAVITPPWYGIWINRGVRHRDTTHSKQEFFEVVYGCLATEQIASLLNIAIKNSITATRHRRDIQRMLNDINVLKYATQRGGRSTAEVYERIKLVLSNINDRFHLLKQVLEGHEMQSIIQYCINHPESEDGKKLVVNYFSDAVHFTLLGYQKLDEVVRGIHMAYSAHEDPKPTLLADLDKIKSSMRFHNEKLLGGNIRKSA